MVLWRGRKSLLPPTSASCERSLTMKVVNTTGTDLYVVAVGDVVAAGDTIDVDSETANALTLQGWGTNKTARKATTPATPATPQEDI